MNEMTSVATNGSWVTTTRNTSAGSNGARRAQAARRGWARAGRVPTGPATRAVAVSRTLIGSPSTVEVGVPPPGGGGTGSLPLVRGRDLGGQLLAGRQGGVHAGLAGDGVAEQLRHLG